MTIQIELKAEEERAFLKHRQSGRDPAQFTQQTIRDHIGSPPHDIEQAGTTLDELIDDAFVAACAGPDGEDVPTIEQVREILAKVTGSYAEDIIADREDRF